MPNSLYNSFGPKDEISDFINEINNFKKSFNGNPRTEVENLMRSGQLTQEQFNQYAQIANRFSQYIK